MPAYNFKAQFAEAVETGQKRQTLRPKRKRPTKPGDTLYLYTGMRTKQCRKLREARCSSVTPVTIHADRITINGRTIAVAEATALARADGFAHLEAFYKFFERLYGLPADDMEIIKW